MRHSSFGSCNRHDGGDPGALEVALSALSARELQVAARVKAGMPARRIAAELGIAETTVIIHRNSVYARIGVANLRELLLA